MPKGETMMKMGLSSHDPGKIAWLLIRYPGDSSMTERWWVGGDMDKQAESIEACHDHQERVAFEIKPKGGLALRLIIPGPSAAIEVGYMEEKP
jgi:hypothetical protein